MNEMAFLLGSVFVVGYYFHSVRKARAQCRHEAASGVQVGKSPSLSPQGGDK